MAKRQSGVFGRPAGVYPSGKRITPYPKLFFKFYVILKKDKDVLYITRD